MKYALPLLLASVLLLASCKPYRMDIPQGKTLTTEEVSQIQLGMTKAAVLHDLGTPIQGTSPYDENRLDYIYTMQKNGGDINEKRLSIYFKNGIVSELVKKNYTNPVS